MEISGIKRERDKIMIDHHFTTFIFINLQIFFISKQYEFAIWNYKKNKKRIRSSNAKKKIINYVIEIINCQFESVN